jgi:predicted nuclease of restriction endonuclease-like (RecB) superfamily
MYRECVPAKIPNESGVLLDGYSRILAEAKRAIQAARTRATLAVNSETIGLYWQLGNLMVARQETEGWGTKVIERLSNIENVCS